MISGIIKYPTDIIVNSANKSLMRDSGVCGAIYKVAGTELEKECLTIKKKKIWNVVCKTNNNNVHI